MSAPFEDGELKIIDRVFEAAWAQFVARDPDRDTTKDDDRRAALKKRILTSARAGQVEFDKLYHQVLTIIPRRWTRSVNSS
jgi:hypothetical protein